MLTLCPGYNAMAYNPNQTYTPWVGQDKNGDDYDNKTLTTALDNPYDGSRVNLRGHYYFVWDDDGDGVYQRGECPRNFNYFDANRDGVIRQTECGRARPGAGCVSVRGLNDAQQRNYANWYTYYRARLHTAKRALSEVIDASAARLGLATLHNNNNVGTHITDISDNNEKNALLENLFNAHPSGRTPLRSTLWKAGRYFEESITAGDLFGRGNRIPGNRGRPARLRTLNQSPILTETNGGACQRNFTVIMTDGFWNDDTDFSFANADGDNNSPFDGGSHADRYSSTLADVAMRYYERDLSASLPNEVVTAGRDRNPAQHMVTYAVAFGVNGELDANPPNRADPFVWPEPMSDTASTIDDVRHAAWNGRGEFLNAADPQELIDSFRQVLSDIEGRASSAASVSFNPTSLDKGALLFRTEFNPAGWIGDLRALEVTRAGIGAERWSAASRLDSRGVTADNREIITFNGAKGVPFRWPTDHKTPSGSELSVAQVSDLIFGVADPTVEVAFGRDIVNFLRGDHAQEVQQRGNRRQFRNRRGTRLGDIVHSAPVFVGTPDAPYPSDIAGSGKPLYSQFIAANLKRREIIYVGANDGMLHAFDANSGEEVFAYIPGFLFSAGGRQEGLHYLAAGDYAHRSYVDLTATAGDVFVNNRWRTYLVGGVRAGGRGVYVLDITNPTGLASAESNADDIVVREFTASDDPDLGFTYSQITIAKMNNGRWAAVFGNGYNNTGDGTAKIFILYLDSIGGYVELATGVGDNDPGTAQDNNGMSTPEVLDLDNDGAADRIYAGDVLGNMWAFDVSSSDPSEWASAYGSGPIYTPFFVARDSGGNPQPITSKPSVDAHPIRISTATSPNLLVTFGTGQYLTADDSFTSAQQTFYGVWDAGVGGLDRADLVAQTIKTELLDGVAVRTSSVNTVNYLAATPPEYGWRIDLPVTSGVAERNVVDPVIIGPVVFFNTLVPVSAECSAGGTGFLMGVDLLTGGQPPFPLFSVVNNQGVYSGIKSRGVPTAPVFVTNRDAGADATRYVNTNRGLESINVSFGANRPGRTSWTNLKRYDK